MKFFLYLEKCPFFVVKPCSGQFYCQKKGTTFMSNFLLYIATTQIVFYFRSRFNDNFSFWGRYSSTIYFIYPPLRIYTKFRPQITSALHDTIIEKQLTYMYWHINLIKRQFDNDRSIEEQASNIILWNSAHEDFQEW